MSDPSLENLPPSPHEELLERLARLAWKDARVLAIWVGGSIALGKSDEYSDIDFRIAVDAESMSEWDAPDWGQLLPVKPVGSTYMQFGPKAKLHHMLLENGVLLDYFIQDKERVNKEVGILVIASRTKELASHIETFTGDKVPTRIEADAESARQLIIDYWITSHKHLKVMARGLGLMTTIGLYHERISLMRALYVKYRGYDLASRPSIHAMADMVGSISDNVDGPWEALGHPATSIKEAALSIEMIRGSMSQVGKELARRYDFDYPVDLEKVVVDSWNRSEFASNKSLERTR